VGSSAGPGQVTSLGRWQPPADRNPQGAESVGRRDRVGSNRRWFLALFAGVLVLSLAPATPLQAKPTYEMYFPVVGQVHYSNDYGDPRGNRTHQGIDIMSDEGKGIPVVAVASGEVGWMDDEQGGDCCAMALNHDDGWVSWYIHLNNDTPGTDDGQGWGFAPGIEPGVHVEAGQVIGYVGDSGNAESAPPHLHFELHEPDGSSSGSPINPYPHLQAAKQAPTCGGSPATIIGTAGDDHLIGTSRDDVIIGLDGDDQIEGLEGRDTICGNGGRDVINGGKGGDDIRGGSHGDELIGARGNDRIRGNRGHDMLKTGPGDDIARGGAGNDTLSLASSEESVTASMADGTVVGEGTDSIEKIENLIGSDFDDHLIGNDGPNRLQGLLGADTIWGGDGRDRIMGGPGNDLLEGWVGDDAIFAGAGADVVEGGSGSDEITGHGGDDQLDGAEGTDALTGGSGSDVCTNGEVLLSCEAT